MSRTTCGRYLTLALMGVLGLALPLSAQGHDKGSGAKPGVRDHVAMFSPEAVKQADASLEAVHEKTRWQAVIETVDSLDGKTPLEAATAFAKAQQVHGVYVLIAKKETKVQVVASNTAKPTFSTDAEKGIVDALVSGFKAKEFDRGLLDAVALIRKDAEAKPDQAPVAASASKPGAKPGLRDGAGMFEDQAAKKADATLASIHEKTHWQAVIETVSSLNGKNPKDAALANAKALNVHGIYVLIAKKEMKVQVEASRTAKSTFTPDAEKEIVKAFVSSFRARDFDGGLLDAVEQIRKLAEAKPDSSAPAIAATAAPVTPMKPLSPSSQPPVAPTPAPMPLAPTSPKAPEATSAPDSDKAKAKSETPSPAKSPADPVPLPEAPSEGGGTVLLLIVGGLGIVFILWAISRASKRPQQANFGNPGGYGPNPNQAGYGPNPNPNANRGVPPQGYAPPPGYGQGGYPPPGYGPAGYGPPPQQGGGGGFIQGALGGLGGAVVGNILYDKFGRPHDPSNPPPQGFPHHQGGMLPPTQNDDPNAWPDNSPPAPQPTESYDPTAGVGGDWGTPDPQPEPDQGAGGDWGTPGPQPEPDQGGDWGGGGSEPDQGGDWGGGGSEPDTSSPSSDW